MTSLHQKVLFNLKGKEMFASASSSKPSISSNTMTLYYYLFEPPTYESNDTRTDFVTDPAEGPYRGISNRYMSNSTYTTFNTDILTYISSRTPGNSALGIPDMYNEVLNINSEPYIDNYIQAACNYPDPGSGYETEVANNNFIVTAASGIFSGYKNIYITYNNNDPKKTRVMVFTK
jgi:hypothetical protein